MARSSNKAYAKAKRLVTYVTSTGKVRPGKVVTSINGSDQIDVKVGGHTYTTVPHATHRDDKSVWYIGSRRQFLHS